MEHKHYDVAVVGAGVAGIMATALLSQAGKSVVLLERAETIGGRGQTRDKQGFAFNMGAHAIYLQGAAYRLSKSMGVDPAGKPPVINNAAQIYQAGTPHPFPGTPKTILTSSFWTLRDRLSFVATMPKIMTANLAALADVSYTDWLTQNVKSAAVREYLLANGRVGTYTNAADLSAKHALNQFRWVLQKGVRYVDGGWGGWLNAIIEKAKQASAVVQTGQRVTQLHPTADGYSISTPAQTLTATHVILATPPAIAATLLPDGNVVANALPRMKPVKVAALNIALSDLPHPTRAFATATDQPIYYSLHSAAAKLGPANKHLLHLMRYLPDTNNTSADEDRQALERWLDQLQPSWRDHVIEHEYLPRIAIMHDSPRVGHQRIGIETGLANVYLAGDWVASEQILADGAALSAEAAVKRILA